MAKKSKVPCYLVQITGSHSPFDEHGISRPFYCVVETGEVKLWEDLAPGAMAVDDMGPRVKLPDGETWYIDSRAANCGLPKDNVHKCWVRHGEPPKLTVNKKGNTCKAGMGSIQTKNYHGFLRNGVLEET